MSNRGLPIDQDGSSSESDKTKEEQSEQEYSDVEEASDNVSISDSLHGAALMFVKVPKNPRRVDLPKRTPKTENLQVQNLMMQLVSSILTKKKTELRK